MSWKQIKYVVQFMPSKQNDLCKLGPHRNEMLDGLISIPGSLGLPLGNSNQGSTPWIYPPRVKTTYFSQGSINYTRGPHCLYQPRPPFCRHHCLDANTAVHFHDGTAPKECPCSSARRAFFLSSAGAVIPENELSPVAFSSRDSQ